MVVHIKLSPHKTADGDDPLGRSWYGYDPDAIPAELWANNRGDWSLLAERISEERWVALNFEGQVVLVAELEDPAYEVPPGVARPKKALLGRVLTEDHPVSKALIGKQISYSSRNAIQYDPTPELDSLVDADSAPAVDAETTDWTGAAGHGVQTDPQVRRAIEDAAQDYLMNYYRDRGWTVTDTRHNRPYDAVAERGTERIYLEAKGTQSRGILSSSPVTRSSTLASIPENASWGSGLI
ncbi:protein NO VEIN domain-containing protein [Arthrobacter alkaliphilus]|uniref:protein NO VEIN domain-containing protein n=1 Tax=Arthrobacter alkaliphilus TaxID=369936 RepID=UPI001F2E4FFB|nr:DUF3883 domain-containing protein [Arthrobacter alkaliphilus]